MKSDLLLLESLRKFYSDKVNGEKLFSILMNTRLISLRSMIIRLKQQ